MQCIYCLQEKNTQEFQKREHVIPQSLGLFENNFVLRNTVCDSCNEKFGNELEPWLARDTAIGLRRYSLLNKNPKNFKTMGPTSNLIFRISEGFYKNVYVYPEYNNEERSIQVRPLPQIGVKILDKDEYSFFLINKLPNKNKLIKTNHDLANKKALIFLNIDFRKDKQIIEKRLMTSITNTEERTPEFRNEEIDVLVVTTITRIIERVICKIAFNYLATQINKSEIIAPIYNPIRNFILTGEQEYPGKYISMISDVLSLDTSKGEEIMLCHAITVEPEDEGRKLIAKISFFNEITFSIILASTVMFYGIKFRPIGHIFTFGIRNRIYAIRK